MNKARRIAYGLANARRMKLFERQFTPIIEKILTEVRDTAAGKLKEGGESALHNYLNDLIFIPGLSEAMQSLYSTIATYYGKKTLREIEQSAQEKGFGFSEDWFQDILNYFNSKLLAKIVLPISQSIADRILQIITQGHKEGWGIEKMASKILEDDFPRWRARMIVRTESVMAMNYGQQQVKKQSVFVVNEVWISAHDARTRHSHVRADGQVIPDGGRFKVERWRGKNFVGYDYMTGPGDPTASPENIINCRCTKITRAARDAQGNLIRKVQNRNISVILPGEAVAANLTITI